MTHRIYRLALNRLVLTSVFLITFMGALWPQCHAAAEASSAPSPTSSPKIKLIHHLKKIPSTVSQLTQRSTGATTVVDSGTFSYTAKGPFTVTMTNGSSLTFDGQWLTNYDAPLEQTTYIHKDDFPLTSFLVEPALLTDPAYTVVSTPTKGIHGYTITSTSRPEILTIYLDTGPQSFLLGWRIESSDGAVTEVTLSQHKTKKVSEKKE